MLKIITTRKLSKNDVTIFWNFIGPLRRAFDYEDLVLSSQNHWPSPFPETVASFMNDPLLMM